MEVLHLFSESHIDEDCSTLTGSHDNGLFYNCKFQKLNGLSLTNCDLNQSKFLTNSVSDAIGFAVTLDCLSFRGVELSQLIFDLLLSLLTMTVGNDAKRRQLLDVIGTDKADALVRVLRGTERR